MTDLIRRNDNRHSFIFYEEWAEVFEDFNPVDYTQMIKAIVNYALYVNYIPEFTNPELRGVWKFIKRQLDEDIAEYQRTCEKRKAAGAKGGKAKAENQKQNIVADVANANTCYNTYQKPPDNDIDIDIDNDIDIAMQQGAGARINNYKAPSLDDITAYFTQQGFTISAAAFYNEFNATGWKDRNGNNINDWRALAAYLNAQKKKAGKVADGNTGASYDINKAVEAANKAPQVRKRTKA